MLNILAQALTENNISLAPDEQQQLIHYLNLITEWNRVYNLTTITEPREMVYLHIVDSLVVLPYLHGLHLLDVGSGAGLPGIPLAIVDKSREWVLLDKAGKKTRFLTQVVAELGLKNVTCVQSRCEDFNNPSGFDSILSRAFGTLDLFAKSARHLLAQDGRLIAMKGKYPQDELETLPDDFQVEYIKRLTIKGMNVERHIVVLKRIDSG